MITQWFGEDWSLFAWEKVKYRDRNFQSQFGGDGITRSSLKRSPTISHSQQRILFNFPWQNAGGEIIYTIIHQGLITSVIHKGLMVVVEQ